MSDLIVFGAIVVAMAGVGIAVGMIVAGRLDRLVTSRSAEPPAVSPESPATPSATLEEPS